MPYIRKEKRQDFDLHISELSHVIANSGELNYAITRLVWNFVKSHGLSYTTIATVTGVLKNVADEFYRRIAAPFENSKLSQNGDVYQ